MLSLVILTLEFEVFPHIINCLTFEQNRAVPTMKEENKMFKNKIGYPFKWSVNSILDNIFRFKQLFDAKIKNLMTIIVQRSKNYASPTRATS